VFQSRSGFSVRRDDGEDDEEEESEHVSIPVWVFGPSRLHVDVDRGGCPRPFQSRSGFSVRRDITRTASAWRPSRCFNPGLGFRSVATDRAAQQENDLVVSIPVWVFGPSRPTEELADLAADHSFNPGLGFRSVATRQHIHLAQARALFQSRSGFSVRRDSTSAHKYSGSASSFNPGLGFRSVATCGDGPFSGNPSLFQSRSGFSVRRDRARRRF